jgi:2-polyprenyl-3-methyl-5-hydroxy-6-metoxy-1,4-benzoquinol methylase
MTHCCPLCDGEAAFHATATDIEYFTTPDEFRFFHCEACDILFIVPMLADRLDLIYPPNYYSFKETGTKNIVVRIKEWLDSRMFRRLLTDIPGSKIDVLDIGGGTGWLLSILRGLDSRVTTTQVVDIDSAAEQEALAAGHRFFCGRIEDFRSELKFDLILMLNLIEHVARPGTVLQQIAGMLNVDGRILIKTPNFRSLDARLFRHRSWAGYHCPRHFVLFSSHSLEATLEKAGLQVDQFSYTQGAPFWAPSILELMRRRGLVSISAERPSFFHPLTPVLQGAMAAFDFARRPFFPLSQMVVIARPKQRA